MKIDRSNYESYFLDYTEGNIPHDEMDDFLDFLNANPDLKDELKFFGEMSLNLDDQNDDQNWEFLLKSEYDHQTVFDEACIRYVEGDMMDSEKSKFLEYVESHPQKKADLNLFKATKLQSNKNEKYPDINHLIHMPKLRIFWSGLAVAASLALAILVWNSIPSNSNVADSAIKNPMASNEGTMAEVKPEKPITIEEKQNESEEILASEPQKEELIQHHVEPVLASNAEIAVAEASFQIQEEPAVEENSGWVDVMLDEFSDFQPIAVVEAVSQSMQEIPQLEMPDWRSRKMEPDRNELVKLQLTDRRLTRNDVNLLAIMSLRFLSKERVDYKTTDQGQLAKIEYNSRLLAFSIPVNVRY